MYIRNYASRTKWPRLRSASEFGFIIGGEENEAVSKLVEKVGDGLFYAMEADF